MSYSNQTAWSGAILRVEGHAVNGDQLHGLRYAVEHILNVKNGVSGGVGNPPELPCSGLHPQKGWNKDVGIGVSRRGDRNVIESQVKGWNVADGSGVTRHRLIANHENTFPQAACRRVRTFDPLDDEGSRSATRRFVFSEPDDGGVVPVR